jgi:hypothetical protein
MSISPRVLHIIHNPRLPPLGGQKLHQAMRWNDPDRNAQTYIDDVNYASYGFVNYRIVARIEVDAFPVKQDGFAYTPASYLACWRQRHKCHHPDMADYHRLLETFDMVERINQDEIDEVWMTAFPYGGYYESRMAGPGAFWCNAPPLDHTEHAARRFVIMGFSYERGVGEMLENLGHRAESILQRVFRHTKGDENLWERFTRHDLTHPRQAEVGNVHFAPNSERDYDWGNKRKVWSRCDTWYNFPDLSGSPRLVDWNEWGRGDIRAHHVWWLRHFPHIEGKMAGIFHNWWKYVINPNLVE